MKNSKIYTKKKLNHEYQFISIGISSLNIQNCNEQNLLSVMNQSFQDFEIIIVNDASEDKTKSIINLFQSNDEIIQLLSNQNK